MYVVIIFNYKLVKKNRTSMLAPYEGESSGMMMMTAVVQGCKINLLPIAACNYRVSIRNPPTRADQVETTLKPAGVHCAALVAIAARFS